MQRWIVPVIAASFVGAMLVASAQAPPAARTYALLEAATIAQPATDATDAAISASLWDGSGTPMSRLSDTAVIAAASCTGPIRGNPAQAVVVKSTGTRASLIGCTREGDGYRRTLGPFEARVGRNGVIAGSRKREGDGHTPGGTFRLASGFGTAESPGLRQGWLRVDGRDVWVDDSRSALYNTHRRLPANGRWRSAERLKIPAYQYAQVIAYNTDRIPGRGSAIFMHVGTSPTAGCVALPKASLVTVMRWERPGAVVVIS